MYLALGSSMASGTGSKGDIYERTRDAWAWRYTRDNSEVVTNFLLLALVIRHRIDLNLTDGLHNFSYRLLNPCLLLVHRTTTFFPIY